MIFHTNSAAETQRVAFALAAQLEPNDVLLLLGDMGAGKSEFVRGLARGLGVEGYITSPTFTILQVHDSGRLPLYHFDWYRLSGPDELYELSMDEYLQNGGIAAVEWPSRAEEALPERYLEVALEPIGESERRITLTPRGGFRVLTEPALSERTENA